MGSDWLLGSTDARREVPAAAAPPVEPSAPAASRPDGPSEPDPPLPGADGFTESTARLRTADAADPFVAFDNQPWLFTTNNSAGNVPVVTRTPGVAAGVVAADALPELPDWAEPGFTWAPAVTETDAGWVLAFTARHAATGLQCIGVATSPVVGGPYSPAAEPLVCHLDRGGSIDPSFITGDDGATMARVGSSSRMTATVAGCRRRSTRCRSRRALQQWRARPWTCCPRISRGRRDSSRRRRWPRSATVGCCSTRPIAGTRPTMRWAPRGASHRRDHARSSLHPR
jgi:hypothetical protein